MNKEIKGSIIVYAVGKDRHGDMQLTGFSIPYARYDIQMGRHIEQAYDLAVARGLSEPEVFDQNSPAGKALAPIAGMLFK